MNQADRELLELAAKAIGAKPWEDGAWPGVCLSDDPEITPFEAKANGVHKKEWNPLRDDGDCARMEAHLKLNVEWCGSFVLVTDTETNARCSEHFVSHDDDQAARRIASVRVAAEIQRAKEAS